MFTIMLIVTVLKTFILFYLFQYISPFVPSIYNTQETEPQREPVHFTFL